MKSEEIKSKWSEMIQKMLFSYRSAHPNDKQSDEKIIKRFLDEFVAKGVLIKDKDRYRLQKDIDD
ncbi:MAG: hypothetical protein GY729_02540 [Desulfobacteraceae bacterium]|nr:hypothetical protein [Desulfobacteraceae bacterium]